MLLFEPPKLKSLKRFELFNHWCRNVKPMPLGFDKFNNPPPLPPPLLTPGGLIRRILRSADSYLLGQIGSLVVPPDPGWLPLNYFFLISRPSPQNSRFLIGQKSIAVVGSSFLGVWSYSLFIAVTSSVEKKYIVKSRKI